MEAASCFITSFTKSSMSMSMLFPAAAAAPHPLLISAANSMISTRNHHPSLHLLPTSSIRSRPLSVACSLSNPAKFEAEEEGHLLINSDWREFRARLVASERKQQQQLQVVDSESSYPDYGHNLSNPTPIHDEEDGMKKWAHPIEEPEKGCLLLATHKLDGSHIYRRTVILLLSSGPTSLSGVILNRPSFMSIEEMEPWASNVPAPFRNSPLFFGGPFEEGLFLFNRNGERRKSGGGFCGEVMEGLNYGTRESVSSCCTAENPKSSEEEEERLRFFDGFCVWERDELREEIKAGNWALAACSPSVIGLPSTIGLWDEINMLMAHNNIVS